MLPVQGLRTPPSRVQRLPTPGPPALRTTVLLIDTAHMSNAPREAPIERDALTADGLTIHLRTAHPDDVDAIGRFHDEELSDTSSYYRFFGTRPHLSHEVLTSWATADSAVNATMLALLDDRIVAVGLYRFVDAHRADAAFAVADRLQHRGIATLLLEDLCVLARRAGYERLIAETLPDNTAMKRVFSEAGLEASLTFDHGLIDVRLPLGDGSLMKDVADRRDRVAVVASLRSMLHPTGVVVLGASATHDRPGNVVIRNLQRAFGGPIHVVHPGSPVIEGIPAYASVAELPSPVDLAVIAVPASTVPAVIDDCGNGGIRSAVILSAGFTETGVAGADMEREILRRARRHGMRIVGPNCFGVATPAIGLDATFGTVPISSGSIAFASQSGGLGIALLAEVARRGLGISSFVSLGNKLDVSSNDLLCYWEADPSTRVIALYLESFGNPRKFTRLARSISRHRPIVALKGGRTDAGRRGAQSHTAALATDDRMVDAVFNHAGIIRAGTIEELIDVVAVLDHEPLPRGSRIALIGNAGGPLILAADTAEASGLAVPTLSATLQARIRELVPAAAATANPVDLLATATHLETEAVVDLLAGTDEVDAIAVVKVRLGRPDGSEIVIAPGRSIPVVTAVMGADDATRPPGAFTAPERAIHALSRVVEYAAWRRQPPETIAPSIIDVVTTAVARQRGTAVTPSGWHRADACFRTLHDLGIAVADYRFIGERSDIDDATHEIGFPLVLKAEADGALHKTQAGAVVLDVQSADAARVAFDRFSRVFADDLRGVLVQRQLPPGTEVLVGLSRNERFGPLLVVGAGGTNTELMADREVLVAPATRTEIGEAISRLRIARLLHGDDRHPGVDIGGLVDIATRIGLLADLCPELVEIDLNPVAVTAAGATALDVRMRWSDYDNPVVPLRGLRPAQVV